LPINLASYVQPRNATNPDPALRNTYYLLEDIYQRGGYQVRVDHADRDSINSLNRKAGMLVMTWNDQKLWVLQDDLLTWKELALGGSGGGVGKRTTIAYQTNPLDPGSKESFSLPMSASCILYSAELSSPGELKIYGLPDASDPNPYTFVGIPNHLTDDGIYVNSSGIQVDGRRYTVLFNLQQPQENTLFGTLTNTSDATLSVTLTLSFLPLEF
jgi:hypothetical protein